MESVQFITAIGSFLGIFIFILDGKTALFAATEGIRLCMQTVIPALFPFFVCTNLLMISTLGTQIRFLNPLGKLFSLPKGTETLLIPSFLGGYPVGAQCVADAFQCKQLSKNNAELMLSYCSNAGPSFLFGIIGCMFTEIYIPWLLWLIHIASAWMVSKIYTPRQDDTVTIPLRPSGNIIISSVKNLANVCGWIILFRVILAFCDRWFLWIFPLHIQILITGILELTNGCSMLHKVSDPAIRFLICSIILSLGGICVTFQTISVTHGLSPKYYIRGKVLQCLFSILLCIGFLYKLWVLPVLLILYFSGKTKKYGSIPKKAVV